MNLFFPVPVLLVFFGVVVLNMLDTNGRVDLGLGGFVGLIASYYSYGHAILIYSLSYFCQLCI